MIWLAMALGAAVMDWFAVAGRRKRLEYLLKPTTMVLILMGAIGFARSAGNWPFAGWFLAALALSLLGDIFLMLPGYRWFVPGLGAFLLAHLCYVAGFNIPHLPPASSGWLGIPIAVIAVWALRRVLLGVRASGSRELEGPVLIYGVVLSLTLFSGWASWWRADWTLPARLAASVGVTLFFSSDLMLAWDRFVQRSHALHVAVIVTYHLAQIFLAAVIALS